MKLLGVKNCRKCQHRDYSVLKYQNGKTAEKMENLHQNRRYRIEIQA
jgi:hypothetical protein